MGARVYTNILTVNGVSFYSGNGDPNGSLSAARGSFFSDKMTGTAYMNTSGAMVWVALGASSGGVRSTFVWRGAGPPDPTNGVYDTFADAHAAAIAVEGFKTIVYDNQGVQYSIVSGSYDMANIQLLGDNSTDPTTNSILVEDGATFTNWSNGAPFCYIEFASVTVPAITITALDGFVLMRTGESSFWNTANTGGLGISPILVEDGAVLSFIVDNLSTLTGALDVPFKELFEIVGPGGSLAMNVFNRCSIGDSVFIGSGLLSIIISGGQYEGILPPTNANFSGFSDVPVGSTYYSPLNLVDWSGTDPQNVAAALDRIASVLTPIP